MYSAARLYLSGYTAAGAYLATSKPYQHALLQSKRDGKPDQRPYKRMQKRLKKFTLTFKDGARAAESVEQSEAGTSEAGPLEGTMGSGGGLLEGTSGGALDKKPVGKTARAVRKAKAGIVEQLKEEQKHRQLPEKPVFHRVCFPKGLEAPELFIAYSYFSKGVCSMFMSDVPKKVRLCKNVRRRWCDLARGHEYVHDNTRVMGPQCTMEHHLQRHGTPPLQPPIASYLPTVAAHYRR